MTSTLASFMTAAIINKKRREMFHAFRVSGAISQATGKALDESRLKEVDRFRRNAVLITLIILFAVVILFSGRH